MKEWIQQKVYSEFKMKYLTNGLEKVAPYRPESKRKTQENKIGIIPSIKMEERWN